MRQSFVRKAVPFLALIAATSAFAGDDRPSYKPSRYDEDWRMLCDPAKHSKLLDSLKCLQLADGTTLTIGGDFRERYEGASNPGFGFKLDRDQALLTRAMLHGDLHLGENIRTFFQLGFFEQTGRQGGPLVTDVDRGDLMQGFLDLSVPVHDGRATLRSGRQEISFGSSRLVSVRDGPNIRRAFDGVRGLWSNGSYRFDAFFAKPVTLLPDTFDDRTNNAEHLGGVYLAGPVPGLAPLNAELYWFDYARDEARFASGLADEKRQSVGSRLFGKLGGFDWDIEGVYQWGSFGTRDISAWTVASNVGFTVAALPGSPRLGLKADIASGDHSGGKGSLGTFNALYPRLPYFSEANVIAPANITDLHPEISFSLTPAFKPYVGWNILWRETTVDAIYRPPLVAIAGTAGKGERYIGQQAILGFDWELRDQITFTGQYVHFWSGETIRALGGRDVDFVTGSIAFRF